MSQINVNTITGKDGGSAVNFPHGITVTGVVTATQLTQNVTGDITASGTLTGGAFNMDAQGNTIGDAGAAALVEGLKEMTNLKELNLQCECCMVGIVCQVAVMSWIKQVVLLVCTRGRGSQRAKGNNDVGVGTEG